MDRQLTIKNEGDSFYVVFHNYMGPWEGHRIGNYLELSEIKSPAQPGAEALQVGQYYMWHAMDRHPDIHAKVPRDKALLLSRAVEHFHVSVMGGKELLPDLPDDEKPPHNDFNFIEQLEMEHQSVWHKGRKAIAGAFLLRAIPAAIVIFALIIVNRHMGDHYREADLDSIFAMADRTPVSQSFVGRIMSPDYSDRVLNKIVAVRYMEGNRIILADGNYIAIHGMSEVKPMLYRARDSFTAPKVKARVSNGAVHIEHIDCAGEMFAQNGRLERVAKLGRSDEEPFRGSAESAQGFVEIEMPPASDTAALEELVGKRITQEGRLQKGPDGDLVLKLGTHGIVLRPSGNHEDLALMLETFAGAKDELMVDMVIKEIYPLRDSEDPAHTRTTGKMLGRAEVYSASVQQYHIVAKR